MSTFPLIGVSMPERAYVNSTYLNAIQQAGGVPVALPAQLSPRSWERLAAGLDGLLLTGGGDIDPALFGETPHSTLYDVAPIHGSRLWMRARRPGRIARPDRATIARWVDLRSASASSASRSR